ncbi:MAG TPA: SLBB domain-containing protein, partial [Pseudomonadales bacterium]|nr:SLBB domain-containing protein [Pseudomonadales bacterium]
QVEPEPVDRGELLEPYLSLLRAQTRDGSRIPQFLVAGEVQAPGTYPLVADGSFQTVLLAAGGLLESADGKRAVVLRKPEASGRLEVFEIPMTALRGGSEQRVMPGDVITIGRDPSLANSLEVEIGGEVASPGVYTLPAGSRLSDLLEIAGGVTPRADLRSAILSRARLREMEDRLRERYLAEIRKNLIDAQVAGDSRTADPAVLQLLDELQEALDEQSDGRLQIDLPRLAAGDDSADIALSTGDRLTLPSQTNAVSVAGQVRVLGSFAYVPGMTAEAYLELAGGMTSYADDEGVFIVRADGSVETVGKRSLFDFNRTRHVLLPGDRIVVPIDT